MLRLIDELTFSRRINALVKHRDYNDLKETVFVSTHTSAILCVKVREVRS